ncbi:hypothetical protein GGX14DRAFT_691970 [Mycena pura]|uniref:Yeast cell wall synthesis Kre9/Knh1-like N-terminal domain-containing protein n=1 Tax=Mycena pura TaxID=153505 RepID=A0AAD6YUW2_9AGAR|nr:hypothetical protein GGX14DRAFT_691970 [Mycena pura]
MLSSPLRLATVLALAAAAHAAVSNLSAPTSAVSGGTISVTWDSDNSATAPVTVALYSKDPTYDGPFAIANNVNPQDNKATVALPDVIPGPGYTIALISMTDTGDVLAASPPFSIAPAHASAHGASTSTVSSPRVRKSYPLLERHTHCIGVVRGVRIDDAALPLRFHSCDHDVHEAVLSPRVRAERIRFRQGAFRECTRICSPLSRHGTLKTYSAWRDRCWRPAALN